MEMHRLNPVLESLDQALMAQLSYCTVIRIPSGAKDAISRTPTPH